ncbi:MAG TPA: AI-2E family transporter [Candidatus Paceibacterota bacterium]
MHISITTGTIVRTVILLGIVWMLYFLRDLVLVVLAAVVFASAIEPSIVAFARFRIPRLIGVILIYIIVIGLVAGVFYAFIPSVLQDLTEFTASFPTYLEVFNKVVGFEEYTGALGLPAPTHLDPATIVTQLRERLNLGMFDNAFSAISGIFGGVLSLVLIVVLSFYFAVVETGVADFLRIVSPQQYQSYILDLWKRSQRKIGLWMQGQLLLGVVIAVLVYLGLTVLGIPHALLLAVFAGMFELLPVFGPILSSVPAILIGFVDGGFTLGILVIAFYVILQQFENHLIYPLVVTKVVGVPPLLVVLALIIGAQLAGFLGILLSIPVAAAIQELVADIQNRRVGISVSQHNVS